jgi:hypothetical protein
MNEHTTFERFLTVVNGDKTVARLGPDINTEQNRKEWIEYRPNDRECNAIEDCPCYIPFLNAGKLEKRQ